MNFPDKLFYSKDHEWVDFSGESVKIGITDFAQEQLGDIVFVEFPEIGQELSQGDPFGEVEAVKTVSDLIAPINGIVMAINESLEDSPDHINQDPYGQGWLIEVKVDDSAGKDELLSAEAYQGIIT
ncbi:MAG: glycine cleavage system protein GcvH [Candidatus Marinimicrobia bacterium]|nr:glycine cleavage system protein GcvH [Candidatus Neomarinimicrobiota bacterium]